MNIVLVVVIGYVVIGAVFATWFVVRGANALDAAAGASGRGFRVLIFPGAVLLWPYLANKVARGRQS